MSELRKRFQMDKMLERTVAACVNDFQVPHLLKLHNFPPDVVLGLAFFHVDRNIGYYSVNDDVIKVLIYLLVDFTRKIDYYKFVSILLI